MTKSYLGTTRPMRWTETRQRKSFVAQAKDGEAESLGESGKAADAVPSFVG
jgi:hypothetical protein